MTEKDLLPCHGQFACMHPASTPTHVGFFLKLAGKFRNAAWHLRTAGVTSLLRFAYFKALTAAGASEKAKSQLAKSRKYTVSEETLNLQPGEWVEVKSEEEIWSTLDLRRRHKGMSFMKGMRDFCGKRLRVYKRVEHILLESTGEIRKIKNTVLLEGAICDGLERGRCDRSCFFYWKEVWLRRVDEAGTADRSKTSDA
jgi:hypothetical protein